MPITIEAPTIPVEIDQATAKQTANDYIRLTFGAGYHIATISPLPGYWWVRIGYQPPDLTRAPIVGSFQIHNATGQIVPLTQEAIQEMRERAAVMAAYYRNTLARDANGLILAYQAKVHVNGYMSRDIAFFAGADGRPTLIAGEPPRWRVSTVLRLRDQGKVVELGALDVDAVTGAVIPLTTEQIQVMQRRAERAATTLQRSAAAPG